MKKGLIFVLFALVSIVSYSQVSWNAKVGMNLSNLTGDADTDLKVGFQAGVGMEYQFTDMWSLQPSLMYTTKGAKVDGVKINPLYLELPIFAAARLPIADSQNIVIKGGPYLAYGVGGKSAGVKIFDNEGLDANRFDLGLGVGVAYEIGRIFVDLTGEFGLTKVFDGDGSPKNLNFAIGVGYKF
ncbi:porin family protein [Bacteroides reticulotermitis]|uniref:Outer membrane protein beta-barrel domain-containing protein n=2 Tax=Bacteroides reticulotermitis TaxID=1133319 RepID=W4UNI6_9BACE|nr:porin family protein [Bacteroides reticulotermitis]MBB4042597.1 opacity protein-like surface antigen [Bacteroides reticulotermitis]GAE82198.1 hypothetical protein JCM10512_385 [Bacteroides reticulotermitis JCM 10512]